MSTYLSQQFPRRTADNDCQRSSINEQQDNSRVDLDQTIKARGRRFVSILHQATIAGGSVGNMDPASRLRNLVQVVMTGCGRADSLKVTVALKCREEP